MKISKSLLQAIAVAVAISTTVSACTKDNSTNPNDEGIKKKNKVDNYHDCPGCGMG